MGALSIDKPEDELKHEYLRLRPDVAARMDTHLSMTQDTFRACVVESLSEVAENNRGPLFKLLVIGLETMSSSSQLERDLQGVRELWNKRCEKLSSDKLCKQLRIHL